jgi:hypothetical protein
MSAYGLRVTRHLRDPAAFGRLLGLDRAPEVKTLPLRGDQRGHLMGFLYGHVRAYHGQCTIASKAYVARRHLAMPASTDYRINDPPATCCS